MKYTVEGFNQALAFELGLDTADLALLRWLVDFAHTGKMTRATVAGNTYYWVNMQTVLEDLPILRIRTRRGLRLRLARLVTVGVLTFHLQDGKRTYYGFVPAVLDRLLSRPEHEKRGELQDPTPNQSSGSPRTGVQPIDPSTNDSTTPAVADDNAREGNSTVKPEQQEAAPAGQHSTAKAEDSKTCGTQTARQSDSPDSLQQQIYFPAPLDTGRRARAVAGKLEKDGLLRQENLWVINAEVTVVAQRMLDGTANWEDGVPGLISHGVRERLKYSPRNFPAEERQRELQEFERKVDQVFSALNGEPIPSGTSQRLGSWDSSCWIPPISVGRLVYWLLVTQVKPEELLVELHPERVQFKHAGQAGNTVNDGQIAWRQIKEDERDLLRSRARAAGLNRLDECMEQADKLLLDLSKGVPPEYPPLAKPRVLEEVEE